MSLSVAKCCFYILTMFVDWIVCIIIVKQLSSTKCNWSPFTSLALFGLSPQYLNFSPKSMLRMTSYYRQSKDSASKQSLLINAWIWFSTRDIVKNECLKLYGLVGCWVTWFLAYDMNWTRNMGESPAWCRPTPQVNWKYNLGGCRVCKSLRGQHSHIASRKKSSWVGARL